MPASNSLSVFRQLKTPATARCGTEPEASYCGIQEAAAPGRNCPLCFREPKTPPHHQVLLVLVARLL